MLQCFDACGNEFQDPSITTTELEEEIDNCECFEQK
jgi:hypothetical protein